MKERYQFTNQDYYNMLFTGLFLILFGIFSWWITGVNSAQKRFSLWEFFLLSMATFRMIRLFVYDSVTSYVRNFLGQFDSGPLRTLADLLSCPWCTGVWMAFFILVLYSLFPFAYYLIILLAMAGAGSFIQLLINRIVR
jgi:hypothetical protein